MLDNREIAVGFWLVVFLGWALRKPEVRSSGHQLLRAAFRPKLLGTYAVLVAYVSGCVWALASTGAWDVAHLKPTVVWFLCAALPMLTAAATTKERIPSVGRTLSDALSLGAMIGFVVGFQRMPLPLELLLVPFVTACVAMLTVAERDPKAQQARGCLQWLLTLTSIGILGFAVLAIRTDPEGYFTGPRLLEFAMPVALTILLLPFLGLFKAFITYESLYARLPLLIRSREALQEARRTLPWRFKFNLTALESWSSRLVHEMPLRTREDVRASYAPPTPDG